MRLLVIGINYAPEIISTAVYTTGLVDEMSRQDVTCDVITAVPYYPAWRVFDGWSNRRWQASDHGGAASIVHCPLYVPANPTSGRRILHHVSFALTALPVALWKALKLRPDIVFVVAPSMLSAPIGLLAARVSGARSWLHIQDFEVEAAFATGLLHAGKPLGRLALRFEKWVLSHFDRISTISSPMLSKLHEKGVPQSLTYELRNWANLQNVSPIEGVSPMKSELGINTPYVVLYSGNLANKQGLEIIPKMAKILSHRKDLTFVVCGDGPMREKLQEMASENNEIRFLPLQPLSRLCELLGMADVHLLPQIEGTADLVLPSKLTNMLASGRPVLACTEPGTALAQEVDGAGVLTPPEDAKAAATALEALLDDPSGRKKMGKVARERALARWDVREVINCLKTELSRLN